MYEDAAQPQVLKTCLREYVKEHLAGKYNKAELATLDRQNLLRDYSARYGEKLQPALGACEIGKFVADTVALMDTYITKLMNGEDVAEDAPLAWDKQTGRGLAILLGRFVKEAVAGLKVEEVAQLSRPDLARKFIVDHEAKLEKQIGASRYSDSFLDFLARQVDLRIPEAFFGKLPSLTKQNIATLPLQPLFHYQENYDLAKKKEKKTKDALRNRMRQHMASGPQQEFLQRLAEQTGQDLPKPVTEMSQQEASRLIESLKQMVPRNLITPPQQSFLASLLKRNSMQLTKDIKTLTKDQASALIGHLANGKPLPAPFTTLLEKASSAAAHPWATAAHA